MKGNVMSDFSQRKAIIVDVPGLAYFTPEAQKARPLPQAPVSALEQMFAYYGN